MVHPVNWLEFLEASSIEYVTAGPNTKRGEYSIKCPWCGEDDPSFHLGINPTTGAWGCWRDITHRGLAPHRLVQALLTCSNAQARLVVAQFSRATPEHLLSLTPMGNAPRPVSGHVSLPDDFKPIEAYGTTHKFWKYLWNRGFDDPNKVIEQYHLLGCMTGPWKDRLIFPVYEEDKLIGWQGRALVQKPREKPRYKSENVKHTIYNLDNLKGGKTLYICEGPVDTLKIDFYGQPEIRATCTFGVAFTMEQIGILNEIKPMFDKVVILFDENATAQANELSNWVRGSTVSLMPPGCKDAGEMSPAQIRAFLKEEVIAAMRATAIS